VLVDDAPAKTAPPDVTVAVVRTLDMLLLLVTEVVVLVRVAAAAAAGPAVMITGRYVYPSNSPSPGVTVASPGVLASSPPTLMVHKMGNSTRDLTMDTHVE